MFKALGFPEYILRSSARIYDIVIFPYLLRSNLPGLHLPPSILAVQLWLLDCIGIWKLSNCEILCASETPPLELYLPQLCSSPLPGNSPNPPSLR